MSAAGSYEECPVPLCGLVGSPAAVGRHVVEAHGYDDAPHPLEQLPNAVPLIVPGSDEHRRQRRLRASVASIAFGRHPFTDARQVWAEASGLVEPKEVGHQAATGTLLEDVVREWWGAEHGVAVHKPSVSWVTEHLAANPDFLIAGSVTDHGEVKCTSRGRGAVIPVYWLDQAQVQMACLGTERTHFAVLWGGSLLLETFVVHRDEQVIDAIEAFAATYAACVDLGIEPEPLVAPKPADRSVEVGDWVAAWVLEQRELAAEARRLDTAAKNLRERIAHAAEAHACEPGTRIDLLHGGGAIGRLVVRAGRKTLDRDALAAATDLNLADFEKPGDPYILLEKPHR